MAETCRTSSLVLTLPGSGRKFLGSGAQAASWKTERARKMLVRSEVCIVGGGGLGVFG